MRVMGKLLTVGVVLLMMVSLLATPVLSKGNPLIFRGSLCSGVSYQKSVEAVAVAKDRVYASCDYRMVVKGELISVYYLGDTAAYSKNGSKLWENASGYVVKLLPLQNNLIAGTLGGFVVFNSSGSIVETVPTKNKLYDFVISNGTVYGVDGDVWVENGSFSSSGEVFALRWDGKLENSSLWSLRLPSMPDRIRLGRVIYVGSGMPSGYSSGYTFGSLYGVSYDGSLLWRINLGEWVRDVEVWRGMAVVGTGYGKDSGRILLVDSRGNVLWNLSTYFVEDLLVSGDRLFVSGLSNGKGVVTAYDLPSRKLLWRLELPYRAKVMAMSKEGLLVGTGKFESKHEGNVTKVYSEGSLYLINPGKGKILWEDDGTGYVRSMAVKGSMAVVGTGSQYFYVYDLSKVGSTGKRICGPALLLLLVLLPLGGVLHGRRT
ncbi:outer membrane protein assembly factor BamB family protein [Thermococcus sp.]